MVTGSRGGRYVLLADEPDMVYDLQEAQGPRKRGYGSYDGGALPRGDSLLAAALALATDEFDLGRACTPCVRLSGCCALAWERVDSITAMAEVATPGAGARRRRRLRRALAALGAVFRRPSD